MAYRVAVSLGFFTHFLKGKKRNMSEHIKIEEMTRQQIAAFLPEAIKLAVKSYREFMQKGPEVKKGEGQDNPKNFVEHHKSAKVAISHIELLIKLARWADLPDCQVEGDEEARYLASLMETAETEVQAYQEE